MNIYRMEIREDNAHDLKILGMLQIMQVTHIRMFMKKSEEERIRDALKEITAIKRIKAASFK